MLKTNHLIPSCAAAGGDARRAANRPRCERVAAIHEAMTITALPWTDLHSTNRSSKEIAVCSRCPGSDGCVSERFRRERKAESRPHPPDGCGSMRKTVSSWNRSRRTRSRMRRWRKPEGPDQVQKEVPVSHRERQDHVPTRTGLKCKSRRKTRLFRRASWRRTAPWQGLLYFDLQGQFDLLTRAPLRARSIGVGKEFLDLFSKLI